MAKEADKEQEDTQLIGTYVHVYSVYYFWQYTISDISVLSPQ